MVHSESEMDNREDAERIDLAIRHCRKNIDAKQREIAALETRLRELEGTDVRRPTPEQSVWGLLRADPIGFILGDSRGKIIEMNDAIIRMIGAPSRDVAMRVNLLEHPPLVDAGLSDRYRQAVISGEECFIETTHESAWRRPMYLRIFIKPFEHMPAGERLVAAIIVDALEKRKVIDALIASEERYRVVVETTQDVIYTVSLENRVTSVNKAFLALTGWNEEDVIGKNPSLFIHPDDVEPAAEMHRGFLEKPEFVLIVVLFLSRDGTYRNMECAMSPLYQHEMLSGRFCIARDISERKRHEDELLQAKQKAEDANLAKTNFLMTVSHELRTPLTVIYGHGSMLAGQLPDAEMKLETIRRIGSQICRSSQHLTDLIRDIIDFASIEAGRLRFEPRETDLLEILSFLDTVGKSQAKIRAVAFECTGCDQPLPIYADPKIIRQILTNILGNAFKFTTEGRVRLEVTRNGRSLEFMVSDTGIGIAGDHIERIFEPFFQVSGGRSRLFGGMGLGLPIARHLVEEMKGTIRVTSEPGKGTSVIIYLPDIVRETTSREKI